MEAPRSSRNLSPARLARFGWVALLALLLAACHQDMYNQEKVQTLDPSSFFADGRGSRPNVPGAVIAGQAQTDTYLYTGLVDGVEGTEMPFAVTKELLLRGQAEYDIYCAVCHGTAGYGLSMVAERGGLVPANFHQERLLQAPIGHFYNIITNGVYRGDPAQGGYQSMYSYASRITPEDRWAVAAYIRALQLSQDATLDDVPPAERAKVGP
jgi:mono/diheme cytochrome c family protein